MATKAAPKKETVCPITLQDFLKSAKPLMVQINGLPMGANVKEFSTGSFGWYANGKITVDVGGVPVNVQVGLNLTVVGSKNK